MSNVKVKEQTVSFWTDGKSFTDLLKTFWEEGRYKKIHEILTDGGLNLIGEKAFFELRGQFIGSTRKGDGTLGFLIDDDKPKDFAEKFYWSLINCASNHKEKTYCYDDEDGKEVYNMYAPKIEDFFNEKRWNENPDLIILKKFISREDAINLCKNKIIEANDFVINPTSKEIGENSFNLNGVILTDGTLISGDYQQHEYLYPLLYKLGLVSSSQWANDNNTIHLTGGQYSSRIDNFNEKQIQTAVKYKKHVKGSWGGFDSLMDNVQNYNKDKLDFGGKYNNLMFLRTYYPKINLPKFSNYYNEDLTCIRTSPKYSLPGLLNSKFNIKSKEEVDKAIKEIKADFKKYKDVVPDNKLFYFYQEKIEGLNGVCSIIDKTKTFNYALSKNQGYIVAGKMGDKKLSDKLHTELQKITTELYEDLKKPIQLEFVITPENKIFIVQLRLLKNNFEETVMASVPGNAIVQGKTFSQGTIEELNLSDILIVKEDAKAEELLGKKALIVTSDVQFSHILALSKVLEIPSMYGTGELPKLPEVLRFRAYNKEGFICKIK